jgi:hypothetical protein
LRAILALLQDAGFKCVIDRVDADCFWCIVEYNDAYFRLSANHHCTVALHKIYDDYGNKNDKSFDVAAPDLVEQMVAHIRATSPHRIYTSSVGEHYGP